MIKTDDKYELSIYNGDLSKKVIVECSVKIRDAFPSLSPSFFDVFAERIKGREFSDKKLIDATNHVIDTCIYPSPTIAQFLSYDKKIKLYQWREVADMTNNNPNAFIDYLPIKVDGLIKPMYASKTDVELYDLTLWTK